MVGLFINTVPVRPVGHDGFPSRQARAGRSARRTAARHCRLPDQRRSALKSHLFDHILVFENYPLDERLRAGSNLKVESRCVRAGALQPGAAGGRRSGSPPRCDSSRTRQRIHARGWPTSSPTSRNWCRRSPTRIGPFGAPICRRPSVAVSPGSTRQGRSRTALTLVDTFDAQVARARGRARPRPGA